MKKNKKILYGFLLTAVFIMILNMVFALPINSKAGKSIVISASETKITQEQACNVPVCKDSAAPFDTGKVDSDGCKVYSCPKIACNLPVCDGGKLVDTGKSNSYGCKIYKCEGQICPAVTCSVSDCPNGCEVSSSGCLTGKCNAAPKVCPTIACAVNECELDASGCLVYKREAKACPENCICTEETTTCPTTKEKPIEVEISTSKGSSSISVEKFSESSISIKEGSVSVITSEKLVISEKRLLMETSSGNKEVKVMPSTASETAITQLKLKNYEIELKDTGKPVYEVTGKKDARIIGLINVEMQVTSQIDAETGAIERTKKPWWSFLATG